jgi:hypothetical protein
VKAAVSDKSKKTHHAAKSQCLTSINSAVTSAARLEVAAHSGLPFNLRDKQHRSVVADIAGQFGCKEALLWGRQNGLPWSVWLCAGAAKQNRIDLLHWLYIEQGTCCACAQIMRVAAVYSMSILCNYCAAIGTAAYTKFSTMSLYTLIMQQVVHYCHH